MTYLKGIATLAREATLIKFALSPFLKGVYSERKEFIILSPISLIHTPLAVIISFRATLFSERACCIGKQTGSHKFVWFVNVAEMYRLHNNVPTIRLTHFRLNKLPPHHHTLYTNFNFRYVRLCGLDIPREKWQNYLQGDPDQTPHCMVSDTGVHCLPVTLLGVSKLKGCILPHPPPPPLHITE